jgi:hypothetical protein
MFSVLTIVLMLDYLMKYKLARELTFATRSDIDYCCPRFWPTVGVQL